MILLATRQRGSCMVPMWFRNLTGTTLYRKGFPGRTAAWFPHGSDVVPHFKREQIIAKRHLLAARQRGSCMVPMWFLRWQSGGRCSCKIPKWLPLARALRHVEHAAADQQVHWLLSGTAFFFWPAFLRCPYGAELAATARRAQLTIDNLKLMSLSSLMKKKQKRVTRPKTWRAEQPNCSGGSTPWHAGVWRRY